MPRSVYMRFGLELHPDTETGNCDSTAPLHHKEIRLYSRKPTVCVPETPASKLAPLKWYHRHVQWNKKIRLEYCFFTSSDIV